MSAGGAGSGGAGPAGGPDCLSCGLVQRRDRDEAPEWDRIHRTEGWDVVHSFDTAIPGWLVIVARRHLVAVADLSDAEAAELGPLVRDVSRALHEVVGCPRTYVVHFAESPQHPHVHLHVIPRPTEMAERLRGPGVFNLLGVPEEQRVPEPLRDEIAHRVRAHLLGS